MRVFALLSAALLLAACPGPQAEQQDAISLRTYAVPAGEGEQLRSLLNNAFMWKDQPHAKATVTPDGRLVVVGPEKLQQGVQALVDQMQQHPPTPPPTVKLTYWLVLGKPGGATQATGALSAVGPALEEIQREDGPQQLTLLEKMENVSITGEQAETRGTNMRVEQTTNMVGGRILAELYFSSLRGPSGLRTRLELPPGKLVVLGESGYDTGKDGVAGTLYYVIRADPQTAATGK